MRRREGQMSEVNPWLAEALTWAADLHLTCNVVIVTI